MAARRGLPPSSPLPRGVESDPAIARIRAVLEADCRPLRPEGLVRCPHLSWTPALGRVLATAHARGAAVLGLEPAAGVLEAERSGLRALRARGQPVGERVSRLGVMSRDASGRLARRVERLVVAHAPRLLVVVVDVSAAELGAGVGAGDRPVKFLLLTHREAVTALLRALG